MAVLQNIPPSLIDTLANLPEQGGRNVWLFTVAARARHVASPDKVREFLKQVAEQWKDRDFHPEIDRAVSRAFSKKTADPISSRLPQWPAFNSKTWGPRQSCPLLFSQVPIDLPPEQLVDALFPENSLLCMSLDKKSSRTCRRKEWRGKEANMQFLVANPMTAEKGVCQSGNVSFRCLDNATRSKVYQVVEFDRGTLLEQAHILSSISSEYAPLVLVVWSGGKSLHGWFHVRGLSEYDKLRFFRHAVYLGADSSLWDPSKLVRMPGGRRDNGKLQRVFYLAQDRIKECTNRMT